MGENREYEYNIEKKEGEANGFWKGFGIFVLSAVLSAVTVIVLFTTGI
ncbi:MAG: hypothetical protein SPJ19_04455 [Candidatus Borkfalkiaceae bacterium]|nr:hypothetical protein [Christensenellaceae bacterium]